MCITIHVGDGLTLDGSSIHAHVEDMGTKAAGRLWHVSSKSANPEDTLYVPYESIPQVKSTYSYWASGNMREAEGLGIDDVKQNYDDVLVGMNEKGLVLSCNLCYSREENVIEKGIRRYALRQLVPERCATAREGVELIGNLIDKYGQADWGGLHYSISDEKETWIVETTSYHWVARKLKKNEILAVANRFTIEEDFDLCSEDLKSYAKDKGWFTDGEFSFRKSYALPERIEKRYDTLREQRIYDKLSSLGPAITAEDVLELLSDRYEGTEHFRIQPGDIELWEDVCERLCLPRPLSTNLCQSNFVAIQNPEKKESLGTELWFAFGQPGCFGYIPIFKGSSKIAPEYSSTESAGSAWKTAKEIELKVREYGDSRYLTNKLYWDQQKQIANRESCFVKDCNPGMKSENLPENLGDITFKESVRVMEKAKKLLCYL